MQIVVDPSGHKIEVTCPGCGQKVVFTLAEAGSSIFCRGCGIKIEILSEELESLKKRIESAEGGSGQGPGAATGGERGGSA